MKPLHATTRGLWNRGPLSLLSLLVLLTASVVQAQWQTQSPVPTHLDVRGIGAPSPQHVFVATDDNPFDNGGALFESADGGATWIQRSVPFSLGDPFNGLFFLDDLNGWAYGNDNYRTTDGGTTWTQLPFLGSTYFMRFYTPTFGLTTGNFGRFISRDGGGSWEPSPDGMYAFDFADDLTALAASDIGVHRSTDGGLTFDQVHSGNALSVAYLTNSVAVGIVDDAFMRSTDGGMNWTAGDPAEGKSRLQRVTDDVVLAWGRTGMFPDYDDRILRSADAGQTWTDIGEVMPSGISSLTLTDPGVVGADLAGNMFHSGDAGLTWAQAFVSPGQQPSFLSSAVPAFADGQTGYYGYGAGFVIKSTDGGTSWSQISSGTGKSLHDIARIPGGGFMAVGDNGTVLTSDGTSPWMVHEVPTTSNLVAVQVIDPLESVLTDDRGLVYSSSDAGATWTPAGAAPGLSLAEDLHFVTPQDGWVIGQSFSGGALYHTTNGGDSWTPVPDFLGAYVAVDAEGSHVWAANVTGRFYRSTDGGGTWIQGDLPASPLQIQDMDFFDENIGYAVSWWGMVFRTVDGGITWETLTVPDTDHDFTDIHLLGPNEFWLSTNDDVAYYTATGGMNWTVLEIGSAGFGTFEAIAATEEGDAWVVGFQGFIEKFSGPPGPPANLPPVASFDFTPMGLTVGFTDSSTDPDGFIVSWLWDFGDGQTSTDQNPTHTFDTSNTYIVRLTVTDDDADSGSVGRIIVVQPGPGGTFGDFTEVTPLDSLFVTPQDEDFWVITTAPADYDADGDLDIAVLGYYVVYNTSVEDMLVLLRNDGAAGQTEWEFSYINVPLGGMSTGASDLAWGDVDGDGDLDLAVGTDGETVIYRNDTGLLVLTDTNLPGYWEDNDQADFDLRSITWADYDNDGDPDLLIPSVFDESTFSYSTALMRNDGPNGTGGFLFTQVDSAFAPTQHAQSAWADFDGDQDLDLLLVNIAPLTDEGFIRRYRNDGGGVFTPEDILGSLTIEHGEAQWGDYDGDGDLDVLVAGNVRELDSTYTPTALRVYRNDNETYVLVDVIDCIPCEGWFDLTAATWADYDSDGDMDILLAGTYNSGSQIEGRARVYLNDGTGVFSLSDNELPAPRASGSRGGTFSWLDIDGEGDLDYFIAGQYFVPGGNGLVEAQMHVYRNDVQAQNNAPSSPAGLNAAIGSDSMVLLSWLPSTDDHTPGAALTYDLNLYQNGVPVAIPHRTPEPGNVSAVTEWLLTSLPDGEYEWTLSAVDASYSSSPVASGQFVIGGVTGAGDEELPLVYALERNYPNPFNPSTTIRFSLPERAFVELTVYNLNGQVVSRLVHEERLPGFHEVVWDAKGFASGTYFVRFSTSTFTGTQKIMLLK